MSLTSRVCTVVKLSNIVQCSPASHVTGRRARTKKAKATKIENHAGDRNPTGERDRNWTDESGKSQKSIRSLLYSTQVVSWERPQITDVFTKALIIAAKNRKVNNQLVSNQYYDTHYWAFSDQFKESSLRTVLKKSKLALLTGSGSGLLEIDSNKLLVGRKLLSPLWCGENACCLSTMENACCYTI